MSFEIQPGNQNALETDYCPKFLLCHLLVEVTDDAFFSVECKVWKELEKPHFISRVNSGFAGFKKCDLL